MGYSDETNVELAKKEYEDNKPGDILEVDEGYVGTLSDINNNRSNNGEQIFTYTKTSGGTQTESVTPDAPLSEREKVEEITILYRGSTNPVNVFSGEAGEVKKDWIDNDGPMAKRILFGDKGVTGQLEASSDYLKEMMEKYPNAKINIYAHSLGSMDAQYSLANVTDYSRIKSAHIYNGPNIYPTLSHDQRVNVSALYDKIHNYVDSNDPIGLGYKKGEGTVGKTYKFKGVNKTIVPTLLFGLVGYAVAEGADQHLWGGYRFDKNGNLIDKDGNRVEAWDKPEEIKKLQAESRNKEREEMLNKTQGLSVDVDKDGIIDAQFGRDKLIATDLMPGSVAGKNIVINFSSLQGLSKNLQGLLKDLEQIRGLLSKSTSTNNNVESRKANRTETLEQSIVSYLEQINLIKSIKRLDNFYTTLENNSPLFKEISNYSTYQFSRQFDWFGFSGFKKWCYRSGGSWDYHVVTKMLDILKRKAKETSDTVNKSIIIASSIMLVSPVITLNTKTKLARKGEQTINSFKKSIDDTLKGQSIRSSFEDGIANPLSEVLKVEQANVDKMEECINSMITSVNALAASHKDNDSTIEQNWRSNQDVMGGYKVGNVPADFDTFVKKSNLFDDLEVLKAFDQQVDNTTNTLGDSMIKAFSGYLTESKNSMNSTYVALKDTEYTAEDVIGEYPIEICYKEGEDIHFYDTVEGSISISESIKRIVKLINAIEQDYHETVQTIDSAGGAIPSLKTQLRSYLEDAIYGYSTLSDVIKAQRVTAAIMDRIYRQVQVFLRLVNKNQGKSIEALGARMEEMGTMVSHITEIVEQSFGDKS